MMPRKARSVPVVIRWITCRVHSLIALAAVCAATLAAANAAFASEVKTVERKATDEVRTYKSDRAYDSAYARVFVTQRGRRLDALPVSGCKAHYVNERIDVLISTCGRRWKLEARYVSLVGSNQRFSIRYEAVD